MTCLTPPRWIVAALAVLPAALLAAPARAAEALFAPADLDEALPQGAKRVVILERNPADDGSAAAAQALVSALAALGATAARPDDVPPIAAAELVKGQAAGLCAKHEAQVVAIVEVLTPSPRLMATAKLWTCAGDRTGTVIGPPPAGAGAPAGSRFVAFDRDGAYLGTHGHRLEGAEFYEAVDRPDLASSYRSRRAVGRTFMVGGVVVMTAGAIWGAGDLLVTLFIFLPCTLLGGHDCAADLTGPLLTLAGGGALLGLGAMIGSDSTRFSEREALAAAHNRRLRAPAVTASPFLLQDGGGLAVRGRF